MYRKESELVKDIINHNLLKNKFCTNTNKCIIKQEVSIGSSITDIVIMIIKKRLKTVPKKPLSTKECIILSQIRTFKKINKFHLAEICGINHDHLEEVIKRLVKLNIVNVYKKQYYKLSHDWNKAIEIIAIEAKLKNWKQAIKQAVNYQKYADKSFIVLPSDNIFKLKKYPSVFSNSGVGLLYLDRKKYELKSLFTANKNNIYDWKRDFVFSRLIHSYN